MTQTCFWQVSWGFLRHFRYIPHTQCVRTFWAHYEVMYVGASGHAGPQTALLNHSSRGHHLYMHHLGTHQITGNTKDLQLHKIDVDKTHLKCVGLTFEWALYVFVDIPGPQCCHRCSSSCPRRASPPIRPENWTPWSPARGPYSNHAHSTTHTDKTQTTSEI